MTDSTKALGTLVNGTPVHDARHYDQILRVCEDLELLIPSTDFIRIINALSAKHCLSHDISVQILNLIEKRDSQSWSKAWRLLVEHLPYLNENWYWEFMDLLNNSDENRSVRFHINPKYDEELKTYKASLQTELVPEVRSTSNSCDQVIVNGVVASTLPDFPPVSSRAIEGDEMVMLEVEHSFEDWLNGVEFPSASGYVLPVALYDDDESDSDDERPMENIQLRLYQRELLAHAIAGRNTIIVAPTGSGKTFVAAEIARCHLENKTGSSSSLRKVAFLVPAVHLVHQQVEELKRYLRRSCKVKGLRGGQIGSGQLPKALHVRRNDVLVMTPQILLNMMIDPSPNVDPVPLDAFTLLIFDECHHAEKSHPYNDIMSQYLDMKFAADISGSPALPQVVGLTASLGVGGKDTPLQARLHVLNVCANMDAQSLSSVVENIDDLIEHVSVPTDELVRVQSNYATHPFAMHVTNLMIKIERTIVQKMLEELDKSEKCFARPQYTSSFDSPQKKYSSDYRSWIFGWLHELPTSREVAVKQRLITAFEHLNIYHNALFLNGHVPTRQAFNYLDAQMTEISRRQTSPTDNELISLYKHEIILHIQMSNILNVENAMVQKLKEILLDEFRLRPDSRALIFVCTRELTMALLEFMNRDAALNYLQPARLTGVQASKLKGGQSVSEQLQILEKFHSGYHRVLIATSVAEEGLDVAKCNLIVKYNHVSNEIAMVQRRGRGRAIGSRSILLAQDGWVEDKEMINMIKEKLMMTAVEYISRMGTDWFREEVLKIQKENYQDRVRNKALVEGKRRKLGGKIYDLLCRKCDKFIISSVDIRRVAGSHFVAVDPTIWHRVHIDIEGTPRIYEDLVQAGRIACSCSTLCGNIIKYVHVYLPTLSADAFVQQTKTIPKERKHERKWKTMTDELFVVDPLVRQDLRLMYNALKQDTILMKLEERIAFAERQQEEKRRQELLEQIQGQR